MFKILLSALFTFMNCQSSYGATTSTYTQLHGFVETFAATTTYESAANILRLRYSKSEVAKFTKLIASEQKKLTDRIELSLTADRELTFRGGKTGIFLSSAPEGLRIKSSKGEWAPSPTADLKTNFTSLQEFLKNSTPKHSLLNLFITKAEAADSLKNAEDNADILLKGGIVATVFGFAVGTIALLTAGATLIAAAALVVMIAGAYLAVKGYKADLALTKIRNSSIVCDKRAATMKLGDTEFSFKSNLGSIIDINSEWAQKIDIKNVEKFMAEINSKICSDSKALMALNEKISNSDSAPRTYWGSKPLKTPAANSATKVSEDPGYEIIPQKPPEVEAPIPDLAPGTAMDIFNRGGSTESKPADTGGTR